MKKLATILSIMMVIGFAATSAEAVTNSSESCQISKNGVTRECTPEEKAAIQQQAQQLQQQLGSLLSGLDSHLNLSSLFSGFHF